MDTNFKMLQTLIRDFNPERQGFLTDTEVSRIKETLCIEQMDILQLRNLRDFTVLFFHEKGDGKTIDEIMKNEDICSGIVAVIDSRIWDLGGDV